jgi:hypothetical protein
VQDDLFHILFPLIMRQMTISYIQITLIISAVFGIGIITNAEIYNSTYVLASPTGNTITMKLTDTLQSITSNTSTSVQDAVDDVIADTMDILIDNTMSKLENATIYDNSDTSDIKFEPKIPSGIEMSLASN